MLLLLELDVIIFHSIPSLKSNLHLMPLPLNNVNICGQGHLDIVNVMMAFVY